MAHSCSFTLASRAHALHLHMTRILSWIAQHWDAPALLYRVAFSVGSRPESNKLGSFYYYRLEAIATRVEAIAIRFRFLRALRASGCGTRWPHPTSKELDPQTPASDERLTHFTIKPLKDSVSFRSRLAIANILTAIIPLAKVEVPAKSQM